MMTVRNGLVVGLAVVLAISTAAADGVKSGPQAGEEVPGAFRPLNVNGPAAGERSCLYCRNGANPVVMIFARQISTPLSTLIEKLNTATGKHRDAKMGSFVVFLGSRAKLEPGLKELDRKLGLEHTVLAIDALPGPEAYQINSDADVTVLLYNDYKVEANHAFKKGELDDKAVERILADLPKILPKK